MNTKTQRFKAGHRCPVCGGSDDERRGQGKRCWGFISADGQWCRCTREDHAGPLPIEAGSNAYVHRLQGRCNCGVEHAPADPAPARPDQRKGTIDCVYQYRDAAGTVVVFEVVRFKNPKGFAQRRPGKDRDGKPLWGLGDVEPILYRLPELLAADPALPVWVVEGEKDVDNLKAKGLIATCNPMGAGKWREHYAESLRGRDCVILPDNDRLGREHAQQVAQSLAGTARSIRVVELPGLPDRGDVSDFLARGGTVDQLRELAANAQEWTPPAPAGSAPPGNQPAAPAPKPPPESQSQVLLRLAGAATLFHDPRRHAYAVVPIGNHTEVYPVRSDGFGQWLKRQFYIEESRPPAAQSFQDALGVLEAKAIFDGPEEPVFLRVAGDADRIIIDLGDPDWRVAIVTADGWSITGQSPVRFRRSPWSRPLPIPERGGSIDDLQRVINCEPDEVGLVVAWLAAALRPAGPYPVLVLTGEQGSAKTTVARVLRLLVDPYAMLLRGQPQDERDLMVAARHNWVVALDNLSVLSPWLSDALCRLATGGGFGARTLYTDDDETILEAQRPAILTGITDVVSRGDLVDRSIFLHLPTIPESRRRPERELWADFEGQAPRLLGALLDAVSGGLRILPRLQLSSLPRMADFALFGEAVSRALGNPPGHFLVAYRDNRQAASESALEESPVAGAVRELAERGPWTGTAAELLEELGRTTAATPWVATATGPGAAKSSDRWPRTPRGLSGVIRRLAPSLRAVGIAVAFGRRTKQGRPITIALETEGERPSPPSPPSPAHDYPSQNGDGRDGQPSPTVTQPSPIPSGKTRCGDGGDGGDGRIPPLSKHRIDWLRGAESGGIPPSSSSGPSSARDFRDEPHDGRSGQPPATVSQPSGASSLKTGITDGPDGHDGLFPLQSADPRREVFEDSQSRIAYHRIDWRAPPDPRPF